VAEKDGTFVAMIMGNNGYWVIVITVMNNHFDNE